MNLTSLSRLLVIGMCIVAMSSCIDDDYDLSDINTDAEFKVESLTLPINIDEIYLKSIIDTTGSDIVIVDGTYAISQKGTFHSDDIKIKPVTLKAPVIKDSHKSIATAGGDQMLQQMGECDFPITDSPVELDYENDDVSDEIVSITDMGTRFTVGITIGFPTLDNIIKRVTYRDLTIKMPKGLTVDQGNLQGTYDAETGMLKLNTISVNGTQLKLTLPVTKIDRRSGIIFENHDITYKDRIEIVSGDAVISKADLTSSSARVPSSVDQVTKYDASDIEVTSFSGTLQYNIGGFDIPDVDLSTLPKVLTDSTTNITLVNPQIYLQVNNPVARWRVNATTGLAITPMRGQVASQPCELPAGSIEIPYTQSNTDIITYCLSPVKPQSYIPDFTDATHIAYPSLTQVLAGSGFPTRLMIDLVSPMLPLQTVADFPVGTSLGDIDGRYDFFTPLDLGAGSTIVYTDEETGWGSEDLDKLTITRLSVKALVTTDVPFGVTFSAFPIDRDGNRIGNVEIKGADIKANATDEPLDIYITGGIRNLDGIVFTAVATQATDGALTEGLKLKLSDIKATASGYYTTTL